MQSFARITLSLVLLAPCSAIPAQGSRVQPQQDQLPQPVLMPDVAGVRNVGGEVTKPKLIHYVKTRYPRDARRKKIEGICLLSLIVGTDGVPRDIKVIRSIASGLSSELQSAALDLDENAMKAVQQYRFEPSMYEGHVVPVEIHVEVHFKLI